MSLRLYFDHNVSRAISQGLRLRGVDVITASDDGAERLADAEELEGTLLFLPLRG
ncbi:MAG TPA: hypothetical protein VMS86_07245 [Thermoanaerobaculia bacterium]|nr:hypothetical protein [Thermoanaerobaculia bacterium]